MKHGPVGPRGEFGFVGSLGEVDLLVSLGPGEESSPVGLPLRTATVIAVVCLNQRLESTQEVAVSAARRAGAALSACRGRAPSPP
jgi:hypothetical protein